MIANWSLTYRSSFWENRHRLPECCRLSTRCIGFINIEKLAVFIQFSDKNKRYCIAWDGRQAEIQEQPYWTHLANRSGCIHEYKGISPCPITKSTIAFPVTQIHPSKMPRAFKKIFPAMNKIFLAEETTSGKAETGHFRYEVLSFSYLQKFGCRIASPKSYKFNCIQFFMSTTSILPQVACKVHFH